MLSLLLLLRAVDVLLHDRLEACSLKKLLTALITLLWCLSLEVAVLLSKVRSFSSQAFNSLTHPLNMSSMVI